jgi:hypothetical protein
MRQSGMDQPLTCFLLDVSPQARRPSYARSVNHHLPVLPLVKQGYIMSLGEMT